jgi:hypothetical protein
MNGREDGQMTDQAEMLTSAAVAALPTGARRTLDTILAAINETGGTAAAVSYADLDFAGVTPREIPASLRMLVSLGLIKIEVGPRRGHLYSVAQGWREVDEVEAARLLAEARERRSPRVAATKVVKVPKVRTKRQRPRAVRRPTPSMPRLSILQDGGR